MCSICTTLIWPIFITSRLYPILFMFTIRSLFILSIFYHRWYPH
jgi:hypothetical protein